MEGKNPLYMSV